ncbi:NUDIX domain-containing protein [Streptomyces sp. NPDC090493]|uniref:NUDIX domain-containing protein n=1 Tax=Streptomyces sp. NPDC090493 TaxID=3365964 RepID=UPI0038223236
MNDPDTVPALPDPAPAPTTAMPPAAYGASRAALWTAVSVLFTDERGRVLLEGLDYRATKLLPGGGLEAGEAPSAALSREVHEELGLTSAFPRCLAVDWIPPTAPGFHPDMRFPGECVFVFDGGTLSSGQIRSLNPPGREVTGVHWVEPAALGEHMAAGDARRALAALRARINGSGAAILEDGHPSAPSALDVLQVLRTPRKPQLWPWRTGPVPCDMTVIQSWGWIFAPDGRALVLIGDDTGSACLPGGRPESADHQDPAAVLAREAAEEAQIRIGSPVAVGYLHDDTGARVRMAAAFTHCAPVASDPATGQTYSRLLATPEQIAELFDWGPGGQDQLAAVHAAREQLGLPAARRQPVTELPRDGGWL